MIVRGMVASPERGGSDANPLAPAPGDPPQPREDHMRGHQLGRLAGAQILGLVLLGGGGQAAEIGEHTIKFATAGAKGPPIALGMERFAEIVEEKSGEQISVKLFPGGTLGGDVQTLSGLQGGTVEMTTMNAGLLASVAKDFVVVDLPFLFASPQEADAI